jgi:tryptophan synthase beta chain
MYLLSDEHGQVSPAHSVSAGLDYPGVGPEHAYYADEGRAAYVSVDDDEALRAFRLLAEVEGIIPALETSHALAYAIRLAPELGKDAELVVNLSGRGDKDVNEAMRVLEAVRGEAPS